MPPKRQKITQVDSPSPHYKLYQSHRKGVMVAVFEDGAKFVYQKTNITDGEDFMLISDSPDTVDMAYGFSKKGLRGAIDLFRHLIKELDDV